MQSLQSLFAAVKQRFVLGGNEQHALSNESKDVAVQVQLVAPQDGTPSSSGSGDTEAATSAAAATAAVDDAPRALRQRLHSHVSPLDKDDVLDVVFNYVGLGDFLYTGAVCRRWRGRCIKLCYEKAAKGQTEKLRSSYRSTLVTAARLQLALDSGLKMTKLQQHKYMFAVSVTKHSLDPICVLSLAKLYDMAWCTEQTSAAADMNTPQLLQWLHKCQCPWNVESVTATAVFSDNVEMLEFISSADGVGWANLKATMKLTDLLWCAGRLQTLRAADWLHADGVQWPNNLYNIVCHKYTLSVNTYLSHCWPLRTVKWAMSRGCTWGAWQCSKLAADNYYCACKNADHSDAAQFHTGCDVHQAQQLFAWAHENGCPCTCEADAAAAVAAAAVAAMHAALAAAAVEAEVAV
eukprot:17689-Heterococcus_DN1.PRE.1